MTEIKTEDERVAYERATKSLGRISHELMAWSMEQREEISELKALQDELVEALEPFAREARRRGLRPDQDAYSFANTGLSYGNLRRARSLLTRIRKG